MAAGATGSVWSNGQPARLVLGPQDGMVRDALGTVKWMRCPLLAVHLDFWGVDEGVATTPHLMTNLRREVTKRARNVSS